MVSLGTESTDIVDSVSINLAAGVREALTHLYGSGRRAIALVIDAPSHIFGGGERVSAYLEFMKSAGLPTDFVIGADQTHLAALNAVRERLSQGPVPEALFCYNDDMALGANRALHDFGLQIPADVALIGCDDIAEAPFFEPSLSTITIPGRQAGHLAWEYLQARIADRDAPLKQTRLTAHFTARNSS